MDSSSRTPPDTVTASDIAAFVYCPESFRLTALGNVPANQQLRDAGTAHHEQLATLERRTGCASALCFLLLSVASMIGLVIWVVSR